MKIYKILAGKKERMGICLFIYQHIKFSFI